MSDEFRLEGETPPFGHLPKSPFCLWKLRRGGKLQYLQRFESAVRVAEDILGRFIGVDDLSGKVVEYDAVVGFFKQGPVSSLAVIELPGPLGHRFFQKLLVLHEQLVLTGVFHRQRHHIEGVFQVGAADPEAFRVVDLQKQHTVQFENGRYLDRLDRRMELKVPQKNVGRGGRPSAFGKRVEKGAAVFAVKNRRIDVGVKCVAEADAHFIDARQGAKPPVHEPGKRHFVADHVERALKEDQLSEDFTVGIRSHLQSMFSVPVSGFDDRAERRRGRWAGARQNFGG